MATTFQMEQRRAGTRIRATDLVLLFWPVLLKLGYFIGLSYNLAAYLVVVLMAIVVGIAALDHLSQPERASWSPASRYSPAFVLANCAFLFVILMSLMRGDAQFLPRPFQVIYVAFAVLFQLFFVLMFHPSFGRDVLQRRFLLFVAALPVYLAVNLVLSIRSFGLDYFLKFTSRDYRLDTLISLFGPNSIAIVAGLSLVCAVYLLHRYRQLRYLLLVAPSLFVVFATGSQGMAAASLFACLLLAVGDRAKSGLLKVLLAIWVVSAPLIYNLYGLLSGSALGNLLTRQGELGSQLGVGTGRTLIWQSALDTLAQFSPIHLLGYGYYGSVHAGTISDFVFIWGFKSTNDLTLSMPGLHNASLQYIFDTGYVGMLVFAFLNLLIIRSCDRVPQAYSSTVTFIRSAQAYVLICGFNETIGSIYHFEAYAAFLGLLALSGMLQAKSQSPAVQRPVARGFRPVMTR